MKKWFPKRSNRHSADKKSKIPQTKSYLLIEGIFSPSEAADVMLSLLNDKIKFHTVQLLNLENSDWADPHYSKTRIAQLKQTKHDITEGILDARNRGEKLRVHSTIEISRAEMAKNISQTSQNLPE